MNINKNWFVVLSLLPFVVSASDIIKCKDINGRTVFTQNKSDCAKDVELQSALYSKNKPVLDKYQVSYRRPYRDYIRVQGKWGIHIEASLNAGDIDLYNASLIKLTNVLDEVFSLLPSNAADKLSGLKFYLLWGDKSPLGGRKSGMSYIRKGEPNNYSYLDKRWEHSVVIYNAENLMYLNDLWSKKALMHELAHARHITNWPERHAPIYDAWENIMNSDRYLKVKDIKGKIIKSAYARKNQLEYFAELSAIYFVGGNYYPYNRKGLKQYDLAGYKMIEFLWR